MAAKHFQQCRFARAVVSNQAGDFSDRKGDRQRMEKRATGYAEGNVSEAKRGIGMNEFVLHGSHLC